MAALSAEQRLESSVIGERDLVGLHLPRNPQGQIDLDLALDKLGEPPKHRLPEITYINQEAMFTDEERKALGIPDPHPLTSALKNLMTPFSRLKSLIIKHII